MIRQLWWRIRGGGLRPRTVRVGDFEVVVLPEVFDPVEFHTGAMLVATLPGLIRDGDTVLELGTGSGAAAIAASRAGGKVVATDINRAAVRCARMNAQRLGQPIEVLHGDLFEPVKGRRFDRIVWNPPYYPGDALGAWDHAWVAGDSLDRFVREVDGHLNVGGTLILAISDRGLCPELVGKLAARGFAVDPVQVRRQGRERLSIVECGRREHPSPRGG